MKFSALLDTGSGLSLIGDAFLERCSIKRVNVKETSPRLQLVSGTVLRAVEVVRLYMRFAGKNPYTAFHAYVGVDRSRNFGGTLHCSQEKVLDLANKGFYVAPEDIFFPFSQPSPHRCHRPVNATTPCQFCGVFKRLWKSARPLTLRSSS